MRNTDPIIKLVDALSWKVNFKEQPLIIKESDLGMHIKIKQDLTECNNLNIDNDRKIPPIKQEPLLSQDDLITGQKNDIFINSIREKLLVMKQNEYFYKNGKAYILHSKVVHFVNSKNFVTILCPKSMSYQILEYLHNIKDHCSINRLIFYSNKLNLHITKKYETARNIVNSCYLCQITKPQNINSEKTAKFSLRPSLGPFQNIRADLMDFTTSSTDFRYLLTVLDTFSLFLETIFYNK